MIRRHLGLCLALSAGAVARPCGAQPAVPSTVPAATAADDGITLNFPANVPLKTLLDYASARLDFNVIYDEPAVAQRVTIRSPARVRAGDLLPLVRAVLRAKGLALIDGEQPGFKRVVPLSGAAAVAGANGDVVTQVIPLERLDPAKAEGVVKPMLTPAGGSVTALPEQRALIVTDFGPTVAHAAAVIRMLDAPARAGQTVFVPLKYADAAQLAPSVEQVLGSLAPPGAGVAPSADVPAIGFDARTNQLVIAGSAQAVEAAKQVAASLDVPVTSQQSPVRFYKLANTTAAEVLATIASLEGADAAAAPSSGDSSAPAVASSRDVAPPSRDAATSSRESSRSTSSGGPSAFGGGGAGGAGDGPSVPFDAGGAGAGASYNAVAAAQGATSSATSAVPRGVRARGARVAADPHTNSIIVEGPPAAQALYEQLVRQLDKRRPQVLIEATIVTLDTSHDQSVGVEIGGGSHGAAGANNQYLLFSSFGLSNVGSAGRLSIIPGLGFNGTLLSSDIADVVVRALEDNSRAKVSSAPRILVNDNSTGTLSSDAEQPYTSNNFNNTVSTTSFAGYATAGTEISVTPHISEADYLQLDYSVSLSNFTASAGAAGIPPPRNRNQVQSKVTIPDGSTIVVGGLNRRNFNSAKSGLPLLGDLPVLEYLFSSRNESDASTTLFVFIRPVILRDDDFADLKYLSGRDVDAAGVKGDFPVSEPLSIR